MFQSTNTLRRGSIWLINKCITSYRCHLLWSERTHLLSREFSTLQSLTVATCGAADLARLRLDFQPLGSSLRVQSNRPGCRGCDLGTLTAPWLLPLALLLLSVSACHSSFPPSCMSTRFLPLIQVIVDRNLWHHEPLSLSYLHWVFRPSSGKQIKVTSALTPPL